MDEQSSGGAVQRRSVSRRDALKRGAVVGGALLWVTPVVQVIGLGQANAQSESGGPAFMRPGDPAPKEKSQPTERAKKGQR